MSSAEFAHVDVDFVLGGTVYTGHPYLLTQLALAHSANIKGQNQVVAVVDDGFRLTHDELDGQIAATFGNVSVKLDGNGNPSSHGTHVAALIAGKHTPDGTMFGVAPEATLHLSSFVTSIGGLTNGLIDAANHDAVAINNSWGWIDSDGNDLRLTDFQKYMDANNATAAQAFTHFMSGSDNAWNNYFNALDDFQQGGVVVWALTNDSTFIQPDVAAALPVIVPELQKAWIAVGNGAFNMSGDAVTNATRLSGACGQIAAMCIFADGTTRSAAVDSDDAYTNLSGGVVTGTSFAAPQVSGAIALVAQTFDQLSPNEWTMRILASAYNDFSAFSQDGITDFGNGVEKAYSLEWGMGTLDVAAALQPIDETVLINGRSVHDGTRHALSGSSLSGNGAFGDGLARMLSGTEIAVFDGLNGNFRMDAGLLVHEGSRSLRESAALPQTVSRFNPDRLDMGGWGLMETSHEIALEDTGYAMGFSTVGGAVYLQDALGLSSENVDNASVFSLAGDTTAVLGRYDMGFASFEHYGFAGTHTNAEHGTLAGAGAALAFDFDALEVKFGISQMAETGAYLGMTSSAAFATPGDTSISAVSLAATSEITAHLSVFGGLEYGVARGSASGGGYVSHLDPATFSGFQVGVRASDLWLDADRLTFTASQPLRVETGTLSLDIPVGRTKDGTIVYDTVSGALAPSGRQLDLGLSYGFEPNPDGLVELGFVYSHDAGHVAGRQAAAVAANFKQAF